LASPSIHPSIHPSRTLNFARAHRHCGQTNGRQDFSPPATTDSRQSHLESDKPTLIHGKTPYPAQPWGAALSQPEPQGSDARPRPTDWPCSPCLGTAPAWGGAITGTTRLRDTGFDIARPPLHLATRRAAHREKTRPLDWRHCDNPAARRRLRRRRRPRGGLCDVANRTTAPTAPRLPIPTRTAAAPRPPTMM
jgi:hypothetical protein